MHPYIGLGKLKLLSKITSWKATHKCKLLNPNIWLWFCHSKQYLSYCFYLRTWLGTLQWWEHIHSINGKAVQKLKKMTGFWPLNRKNNNIKSCAVFGNWFLPLSQEQYYQILSCATANISVWAVLTAGVIADLLLLLITVPPSHLWKQNSFCDNTSVQISRMTKGFGTSQQENVDKLKIS